jgi:hypothetical protein
MEMQNVKFKTIDEMLEYIPSDELKIVECLRNIVLHAIPEVSEKLSYNVLFFRLHTNICFIWPASIFWGKTQTYTGVRFGFNNGNLLQDKSNYLEKGNRKQVYWRDFQALKDIDTDLLKSYLYEATQIDQEKRQAKRKAKEGKKA